MAGRQTNRPLTATTWSTRAPGNFSTRSVTSYDGSGARHVVKLGGTPAYRMRLDLNGKREVCDSVAVTVGKNDVLSVAG